MTWSWFKHVKMTMVVILLNGFYRCTTYATLFLNADQLSVKQVCDVMIKLFMRNILAWL